LVPAYFFHLNENGSLIVDEEGTAFIDDAAARDAAIRAARDVLAGAVYDGRLPLSDAVIVTDHIGQTVCSVTLGAAVGQLPQ
jgi:hypothetical protein